MAFDLSSLLTTLTGNLAAPEAQLTSLLAGVGDGTKMSVEDLLFFQEASMQLTLGADISTGILKAIGDTMKGIARNTS